MPIVQGIVAAPLAIIVLLVTLPARADVELETDVRPAAALRAVDYFVGDWTCAGAVRHQSRGPFEQERATLSWRRELDGMWFVVRSEWRRHGGHRPYNAVDYWGYDVKLKQFVLVSVSNLGGRDHAQSAGWRRDRWIWHGHSVAAGRTHPFRLTYTRQGKQRLELISEIGHGSRWLVHARARCERQRPR